MSDPSEVVYGDLTFTDTHPALTSAIAALRGLHTPAVEHARILELGCGTGFNLLAIAESLPSATCTGIDLSPSHIRRASETATAIGARNVEFHCLSIADYHPPANSFDYIIAHGLYSWVPPAIRESILSLIRHALAPNGLAYVSYNTLPGWHVRSIIRDGLRFFSHTPSPRRSFDLLTQSLLTPNSIYAQALNAEWADVNQQPDYYLAHEYLVPNCEPFYFSAFNAAAAAHGLQFLAEARFFTNSFAQNENTLAHLDRPGDDLIRREQHLDWLVGRYFRQSLLCHAEIPLLDDPDQSTILDRTIALTAESSDDPFTQQLIDQLAPVTVLPAAELDLPGPLLVPLLWNGWRAELWQVRTDTPAIQPGAALSPLARLQAAAGPTYTNPLHRPQKIGVRH